MTGLPWPVGYDRSAIAGEL